MKICVAFNTTSLAYTCRVYSRMMWWAAPMKYGKDWHKVRLAKCIAYINIQIVFVYVCHNNISARVKHAKIHDFTLFYDKNQHI